MCHTAWEPPPDVDWYNVFNDWFPGAAVGTCIYNGDCTGLEWTMAVVGAAPQGKASKILPTPSVANRKLQNIINDLYKGTTSPNRVGTGTTADAVRNELATGLPTAGKWHSDNAEQYSRALNNWLSNNPNAAYRERVIAESLLMELQDALRTAQ